MAASVIAGLLDGGAQTVPVQVLGLTEPCWQCGRATTSVVGLASEEGRVAWLYDGTAKFTAVAAISSERRTGQHVGQERARRSIRDGDGVFNGCARCDAVIPDSVLFGEAVREVLDLDGLAGLTPLGSAQWAVVAWRDLLEAQAPRPVDADTGR